MADELKELRQTRQIAAKDMVAVVQKLYPKYDKTVQSKCENGDAYGITLRPDALKAVREAFGAEAPKRPQKDRHRQACRLSARLDEGLYAQLQQRIKADGFKTVQSWVKNAAEAYLENKRGGTLYGKK